MVSALRDEEWVLWLDADLRSYPADLIQQLQQPKKDFVVPHRTKGKDFSINAGCLFKLSHFCLAP